MVPLRKTFKKYSVIHYLTLNTHVIKTDKPTSGLLIPGGLGRKQREEGGMSGALALSKIHKVGNKYNVF